MPTLTNTYRVTIHATQESVFAYVSDLAQHPEWSGAPLSIEPLKPGPVAVGSQYHSRGDVPGQKDRPNELLVTQYQPSSLFAFIAKDPGFGDVSHTFTFQAQGADTVMERIVVINMPAVQAFLFRMLILPLVGNPSMRKGLAALKAKLEQRSA